MIIYQDTTPYIYKWTHLLTGKWYIGSKIRKGWNPSRHEEYICSSKEVKPMILSNREEWFYEILYTGEATFIANMEKTILVELNAKNNPMSFNQHNGDGLYNRFGIKENLTTRTKKRNARLGEKNPMYGLRGELSPHYNKKHSTQTKEKQSKGLKKYNENRPKEHNDNISKALRGNPKLSARMSGKNNPMYGIPASAYNKQMTKLKNSGDANPMKNPKHQRTCEYCCKTIAKNHYTMFHGSKCKTLQTLKLA